MVTAVFSSDRRVRRWLPRRVLATPGAMDWAHGRAIVGHAAALGIDVTLLKSNRIAWDGSDDPRQAYADAKATLAVVVAPPSKLTLAPIAPSADWRIDLAAGCPAHCSYCYLAGSLKGPPITRVYANLDAIFRILPSYMGEGTITSRSSARAHEGTTFEASCYTDPLALEHLTGSLSRAIEWFGRSDTPTQLRFTTKFAAVGPLLGLDHGGRTRMRASINPAAYARFEGGTDSVALRLLALRQMADAGYPVGLTIAPIIAADGWAAAYGELIKQAATVLADVPDLTIELITHRFNPGSKAVLDHWYPGSALDMSGANRTTKRTKFGTEKQVYDTATMQGLRSFFTAAIASDLPSARILYWT